MNLVQVRFAIKYNFIYHNSCLQEIKLEEWRCEIIFQA